jgi:hypothetical protein
MRRFLTYVRDHCKEQAAEECRNTFAQRVCSADSCEEWSCMQVKIQLVSSCLRVHT